jgi:hypothetical protein
VTWACNKQAHKATHHALLLPSLLLQLRLQHSPRGCVAQHAPLSRCAHAYLDGCSLWAKGRGPSVDRHLLLRKRWTMEHAAAASGMCSTVGYTRLQHSSQVL